MDICELRVIYPNHGMPLTERETKHVTKLYQKKRWSIHDIAHKFGRSPNSILAQLHKAGALESNGEEHYKPGDSFFTKTGKLIAQWIEIGSPISD